MPLRNGVVVAMASPSPTGCARVLDPVHGVTRLSHEALALTRTLVFARCAHVSQLSCADRLVPAATHSRLTHMIGTATLARALGESLAAWHGPGAVTARDVRVMEVAGLCHDLGHGPFSHAFESVVRRIDPKREVPWRHEDMTERMVGLLREDYPEASGAALAPEEWAWALAAIRGDVEGVPPEKAFIVDAISNPMSGLDVDKLDYLVRDTHMTVTPTFARAIVADLVEFARLQTKDGRTRLAFDIGGRTLVRQVFEARAAMHERVYKAPAVVVGTLCMDRFFAAATDLHPRILAAVDDPREFLRLTDAIVYDYAADPPSGAPPAAVEAARAFVELRGPSFVGSLVCARGEHKGLAAALSKLRPEVEAVKISVSMGRGSDDPVRHVLFESRGEPLDPAQLECMLDSELRLRDAETIRYFIFADHPDEPGVVASVDAVVASFPSVSWAEIVYPAPGGDPGLRERSK